MNGTKPPRLLATSREEVLRQLSEKSVLLFDDKTKIEPGGGRTDAHIALLCLDGRATCRLGDNKHEMGRDDLFICTPNQFVENSMASLDFKFRGIVFAPAFFDNIFLSGSNSWEMRNYLETHPIVHLSEREVSLFNENYDFLHSKLTPPFSPYHKEMMQSLLHAMMYEFRDLLLPKLSPVSASYSAGEQLFKRFLQLLETETPQRREVGWYADRLCVTAKYLSAISKKCSGQTASGLINQFTAEHIKRLLRRPDLSVKEVAMSAGFSNISFFGKYVKRELGRSPRQYRAACAG